MKDDLSGVRRVIVKCASQISLGFPPPRLNLSSCYNNTGFLFWVNVQEQVLETAQQSEE